MAAVTQADLDNLNAAIASGTRSVTLGGQTITYGTVDALITARNDIIKQLNVINGIKRRPRTHQMVFAGRGYNDCRGPGW